MGGRLHLYDWHDNIVRRSGYAAEYCSDFDIVTGQCNTASPGNHFAAVASVPDIAAAIESFGRQMRTIDSIWFHTHGVPGQVSLPGGNLRAGNVSLLRKACDKYLASPAYIYFLGCNVGEGHNGEAFLTVAGSLLLGHGGGSVFASDSVTFSFPLVGQWRPPHANVIEAVVEPGGQVTIEKH